VLGIVQPVLAAGPQELRDVRLDEWTMAGSAIRTRISELAPFCIQNGACGRHLLVVKRPIPLSMGVLPPDAFVHHSLSHTMAAGQDPTNASLGGTRAATLRNTRLSAPVVVDKLEERLNTWAKLRTCLVRTVTLYVTLGLAHPELLQTLDTFLRILENAVGAARMSDGVSGASATPRQAAAWKAVTLFAEEALRATQDYYLSPEGIQFDVSFEVNNGKVFEEGSGKWEALNHLLKGVTLSRPRRDCPARAAPSSPAAPAHACAEAALRPPQRPRAPGPRQRLRAA
jgi:hypothetical protein